MLGYRLPTELWMKGLTLLHLRPANGIDELQHYRDRHQKRWFAKNRHLQVIPEVAAKALVLSVKTIRFSSISGSVLIFFLLCLRTMSGPRPVVLSGPSGAGKSTLLKRLMKDHEGVFGFSVSRMFVCHSVISFHIIVLTWGGTRMQCLLRKADVYFYTFICLVYFLTLTSFSQTQQGTLGQESRTAKVQFWLKTWLIGGKVGDVLAP